MLSRSSELVGGALDEDVTVHEQYPGATTAILIIRGRVLITIGHVPLRICCSSTVGSSTATLT